MVETVSTLYKHGTGVVRGTAVQPKLSIANASEGVNYSGVMLNYSKAYSSCFLNSFFKTHLVLNRSTITSTAFLIHQLIPTYGLVPFCCYTDGIGSGVVLVLQHVYSVFEIKTVLAVATL
jgi:hypothetical protein